MLQTCRGRRLYSVRPQKRELGGARGVPTGTGKSIFSSFDHYDYAAAFGTGILECLLSFGIDSIVSLISSCSRLLTHHLILHGQIVKMSLSSDGQT